VGSRLAPFVVLCTVLVAGCGSSSSKISSSNAENMVLKAADLPAGFEAFAKGPTASLDVQGTTRADLTRFGREGGWVERLRREGHGPGLALVVSTVDVFKDGKGAEADITAYGDELARQRENGLAQRVRPPQLGDGAIGARLSAPGGEQAFTIVWIDRNASASVTAFGFGKVTLADVAALARRQQAKLAHAT
jgi:hypothetical protein